MGALAVIGPFLLQNWKPLALGLVALAVVGNILLLRHQAAALKADRDHWQTSAAVYAAANKATAEAFDRFRADQARVRAAAIGARPVDGSDRRRGRRPVDP